MSSWQLSYSQIFMPSTGPVPKAFPSLFEQLDALMLVTGYQRCKSFLVLHVQFHVSVCSFIFTRPRMRPRATTPGTTRRRRTQHQQKLRLPEHQGYFRGLGGRRQRLHSAIVGRAHFATLPLPLPRPRPRGRPRLETREGSRLSAVSVSVFAIFAWLDVGC